MKTESEVLKSNSPELSYNYCLENNNADVEKHEDIIINKDSHLCVKFLKNISKCNKVRMFDFVMNKFKDTGLNNYTSQTLAQIAELSYIDGIDIKRLDDKIISHNSSYLSIKFLKAINEGYSSQINFKKHQEIILKDNFNHISFFQLTKLCAFNQHFACEFDSSLIDNFQNNIKELRIPAGDIETIKKYFESINKYKDKNKTEEQILAANNPNLSYEYCRKNPTTANIKKHKDIIFKFGSDEQIVNFVELFKGLNVKNFQDRILQMCYTKYKLNIIKNTEGLNLELFKSYFVNSPNEAEFKKLYAKFCKNNLFLVKETKAFVKNNYLELINIAINNPNYIDIKRYINVISKCKSAAKLYMFATKVLKKNNIKIEEALLKTKDADWCLSYAINVPKANIEKHQYVIAEANDPYSIFQFASKVKGADIELLSQAMLKTKDPEWIFNFVKDIPNVDLDIFKTFLVNSKYKEEFNKIVSKRIAKENSSSGDWLADNLQEGMYNGMSNTAIEAVSNSIINMLNSSNMNKDTINTITNIINSEFGKMAISMAIGSSVHLMPIDSIKDNVHIQKLSDKCIENAGSKATQYFINVFMTSIMQAINSNEKFRVESINQFNQEIIEEVEEEVNEITSKKSKNE